MSEIPSPNERPTFEPTSVESWRRRVQEELGELDFERALVADVPGVGKVQPLYGAEDVAEIVRAVPGSWPFVRGGHAPSDHWEICPIYTRWSPELVQKEILADLRGGASGAHLRFDRAVRAGRLDASLVGVDGTMLYRMDDLRNALSDVHIEMIALRLEAGVSALGVLALVEALASERGVSRTDLTLSLGFDPLSTLAGEGSLPRPLDEYGVEMAEACDRFAAHWPKGRALAVSSVPFHEAGADVALEVAGLVGALVDRLRALGEAGISPSDAARQIELRVAVGKDLFGEIAKLRAIRGLWSRVLEVAGAEEVAPFLYAQPSRRAFSVRDPWVNMLRETSQVVAAAVGGAEAIGTAGFDSAVRPAGAVGRRVARNTQLILAEETGLAAVADPAGGSYYVEALTEQIADAAWKRFQGFERSGGLTRALVDGRLRNEIDRSWAERSKQLRRRKLALTGVSAFPNLAEEALKFEPGLPRDEAAQIASDPIEATAAGDADARLREAVDGRSVFELNASPSESGERIDEALPHRRDAAAFESLRSRGEALDQPVIFLANLGKLAEHKPRASYAREAFAVGGLSCADGPGTAPIEEPGLAQALTEQFRESGCRALCLCGTDDQYDACGADVVRALAAESFGPLLVAGRPPSHEALAEAGATRFLRAGEDLIETLETVLNDLGAQGGESV